MEYFIFFGVIIILFLSFVFVGIDITIYLIYEMVNGFIRYLHKKRLTSIIVAFMFFPTILLSGVLKMNTTLVGRNSTYDITMFLIAMAVHGAVVGGLIDLVFRYGIRVKIIATILMVLCVILSVPMINKYIYYINNDFFSGEATVTIIQTLFSGIGASLYRVYFENDK